MGNCLPPRQLHLDFTDYSVYKKHYIGTTASSRYNTVSMTHVSNSFDFGPLSNLSDGSPVSAASINNKTSGWVSIDLEMPIRVSRVMFRPRTTYPQRCIKDFDIEASNNEIDWVGVHSGTTASPSSSTNQYFDITPPGTAYRYWRFVSRSTHDADYRCQFASFELYEYITTSTTWGDPAGNIKGADGVAGTDGDDAPTTFSGLSDTPPVYDDGKYLKSTASGIVYEDIVLTSSGTVQWKLNVSDDGTLYTTEV